MLQTFLDGELDGERARSVADHLGDCGDCGFEASVFGEIKEALRRRRSSLPADTVDRMRRLSSALLRGEIERDGNPSGRPPE